MPFSSEITDLLRDKTPLLRQFEALLAPRSDLNLELLARESAAITRRYFGRTMRLFAPLYLSNECINSCAYCGFSRENAILRVTLEIEEVAREAAHLIGQGFRNILLVAGEHPEICFRRLPKALHSTAVGGCSEHQP